jgi:acyl carrier protein
MATKEQITEMVLHVMERELAIPREKISLTDRFVADLQIDSDDLSLLFVPALQREIAVEIPIEAWREVYSVQDAVDLLARYESGG